MSSWMRRRGCFPLCWGWLIMACLMAAGVAGESPVNLLILKDGESARLDQMTRMVRSELGVLLADDEEVRFIEGPEWTGAWDPAQVSDLLERALADPAIDMVFGAGHLLALAVTGRAEPLPKPVVSGFVGDPMMIHMPLDEQAGRSSRSNYSFVMVPGTVADDVDVFREVLAFEHLAILVDESFLQSLPGLARDAEAYERRTGVRVVLNPMFETVEETLGALPAGVDAVYLTPSLLMGEEESQALVEGLNERSLPTFSMMGQVDVQRGVLAGQRSEDGLQIARRLALNVRRIMHGARPEELPVVVDAPPHLVLNARTARSIGVVLPYRVMLGAEVLHPDDLEVGQRLDLATAFDLALGNSPALGVAREETVKARADMHRARGHLLPGVSASLQRLEVDEDQAKASMGMQPRSLTMGSVTLRQVIFNDPVITGYRMSSRAYQAQHNESEARRLDVLEQVGQAYVHVLMRRALLLIDMDNHALTRRYLDLAQSRRRSGVAGPEEVYRWEAQLTSAQSALLASHAQLSIAQTLLNQAMGLDSRAVWNPVDAPELAGVNPYFDLAFSIENDEQFGAFKELLLGFALAHAPELRALDYAIEAQRLALNQSRRRFVVPEVAVEASGGHHFSRATAGAGGELPFPVPEPKDDFWQVAVVASWPLFEGGGQVADVHKAEAELKRLGELRRQMEQAIRQRVSQSLLAASSSMPAIELSRRAAVLAQKNLEIVQEKYARGALPIVELLDAQTDRFVREQQASLAKYQYMLDVIEAQRASGWFPELQTAEARERWFEELARVTGQAR